MGRFSENSTIKELLNDDEAKNIIESNLPKITKHPMIKIGYSYSLKKALGYRMLIGLSEEKAEKIKKELLSLE